MYVTKSLSMYRKSPNTLSIQPPDAPYSGHLVVTDEEAEAQDSCCWGICKREQIKQLPFPQDKILTVVYTSDYQEATTTKVWFIPVLDQPLSSNCYYVIKANGRHKGKACRCSKERDIMNCCFRDFLRDKKPVPLNLRNIYQQVKIHRHQGGGFFAESVAPDGVPPKFLRKKGWEIRSSSLYRWQLSDALGLDTSLRLRFPDFNFPIFKKRSASNVVGKCNEGNVVNVDVSVQREVAFVSAAEAVKDDRNGRTGFTWFKAYNPDSRKLVTVGLSSAIVQNMKWVLEAGGWVTGDEKDTRVQKVEEITDGWRKFGCYVLVESFKLRRMDGSLVLRHDFRHTNTIRSKWE
ncbi:hypothetical protein ACLB2K_058262 [Fragaria x ananassa]